MDNYNFLTIGYDCSPAGALRGLERRQFALPFDWVESSISAITRCFQNNFVDYHTGLYLNKKKTRVIDKYGFQFPHDYPTVNINDGFKEDTIVHNWKDYYDKNLEKYKRRIERFLTIVHDEKPIIILCRYHNAYILTLRNLFSKYYNKNNIFFINANDVEIFLKIGECYIKSCNTEINNIWNESLIWKKNIEDIIDPEKQKEARKVGEDYKIEKPIKKNPRKMLFNL